MAASSEFLRHAELWERRNAPAVLHPPADVTAAFDIVPPHEPRGEPAASYADSTTSTGVAATV
jgi:hypothetical protein